MFIHSTPPINENRFPVATGSRCKTFWMTDATDGNWQPVSLPASTECKSVAIQVNDGVATDYVVANDNFGFLFSSEADGTGFSRYGGEGVCLSLGKIYADSPIIGYIKAAAGNKVAVIILY